MQAFKEQATTEMERALQRFSEDHLSVTQSSTQNGYASGNDGGRPVSTRTRAQIRWRQTQEATDEARQKIWADVLSESAPGPITPGEQPMDTESELSDEEVSTIIVRRQSSTSGDEEDDPDWDLNRMKEDSDLDGMEED
ncbi:hypothetical protein PVAG01_08606 [Phlyctema vagabunda]|uniref:Uncharacterized protein n=1 Tax=Phlyctema vagabunda TaxID=108571 RepID=A0ABR4P9W6_9HELO